MSFFDESNDLVSLSDCLLIDVGDYNNVEVTFFGLDVGFVCKLFGDVDVSLNEEELEDVFFEFVGVIVLEEVDPLLLLRFGSFVDRLLQTFITHLVIFFVHL